jgi:hypothetical protein|tara:strand:- start:3234 stop:3473 length:240 start_codon:yes stop_codon:yes gene_type:complete
MKKTRILRALKKRNSIDYKEDSVLSFKDEKGKEYFLAEQSHYLNIITNAVNKVLGQAFDILDNVKIKNKILKGLNNEKK